VTMKWFRLYTEITRDRKLRRHDCNVRWTWIAIMCMARSSPKPGYLLISEGVPATIDDIADEAAVDRDTVENAFQIFIDLNMLNCEGNEYKIVHWDTRQFSTDDAAERKREYRDKKKQTENICPAHVPPMSQDNDGTCPAHVPPSDTEYRVQSTEEKITPLPPYGGSVKIPYQEIADLWNEVCGDTYKPVSQITDKRKQHIAARWKEHPDMNFWREVFTRLTTAKHCQGWNDRGWQADFDFLLQNNDKYVRLMEGKYDRPTGTPPPDILAKLQPPKPADYSPHNGWGPDKKYKTSEEYDAWIKSMVG